MAARGRFGDPTDTGKRAGPPAAPLEYAPASIRARRRLDGASRLNRHSWRKLRTRSAAMPRHGRNNPEDKAPNRRLRVMRSHPRRATATCQLSR